MKKAIASLLVISLLLFPTACGGPGGDTPDASSTPQGGSNAENLSVQLGAIPADEYGRAVWYGLVPEALAGVSADTPVTWEQYCEMLGNMIALYDQELLPEWRTLTADAPDTGMKRDGAAIALLYAARAMGIAQCNKDPNDFYQDTYSWGKHYSWDYPIFDWDSQTANVLYNTSDGNAIGPSFWFLMGRVSAITLEPMLSIDNGDPHLEEALTLEDAAVSVVRLYESVEAVALQTAEKMLAEVLDTEEAQAIVAAAERRKQEILNTETAIVHSADYIQGETYTGTAYYVSNGGDDAADGKSPETAWATLGRLQGVPFQFGDAIFFERGGLWREAELPGSVRGAEGLTLSAYGEGEKPRFYGSPESGAGAEKWSLYYEGKNGEKIWQFYREMRDCAAVIIDGSTDHAQRILRDLAYWDGTQYLDYNDHSRPYIVEEQLDDMEVFTALPYEQGPIDTRDGGVSEGQRLGTRIHQGADGTELTGPLYVRCDAGNPGELNNEVEFITIYPFADGMQNYTTIDNLSVQYSSVMSLGGFWEGKSTDHVTIQNCVAGWMGGALHSYGTERNSTGFGYVELAGGGFNLNGAYETIQNCYVHHIFQDGVTLETMDGDPDPCENITYRDNIIEYAMYGLTLGNHETDPSSPHIIRNLTAENNYSLYCGFESLYPAVTLSVTDFADGEEDLHWPSVIGSTILDNAAVDIKMGGENFRVTGNTFAFSVSHLVAIDRFDRMGAPVFDGNTYAPLPGFGITRDLVNEWGPLAVELDAEAAIRGTLGDANAAIINFTK